MPNVWRRFLQARQYMVARYSSRGGQMTGEKAEVLLIGAPKTVIVNGITPLFNVHRFSDARDRDKFFADTAPRVRGIACTATSERIDSNFMSHFPQLEIVSSFGVGYDHIDAAWAGTHGIVVTNTPDVLTEEVADTALGLLLCTVREFPQAERHVRAGKWREKDYPLSKATLRNRTVGLVGMGRIGQAIARRLDAMQVPVVYHSRRPASGLSYRHYPKLTDMARDVDVLLVITPGGADTRNLIDADVLKALGPSGILINMARGSVVDETALISALKDKTILSAGLDVYRKEPEVPAELIAMDHIVLFPHLGSASVATRERMDQLVVDNLAAWAAGNAPPTPVPETPWPPKKRA
jgi:lactate dehydrogenase-like 2-hydroxyacid dehydrogenase